MSGWIKLEKDLLTDPRVLKIGKKLCNANALHGVTLALGGLAHLWIIADTHVRNDDVLPLGTDDINKLIGLENFCEILPSDWLEVIDSENVKLPGFHAHNGTQAKKKALTAKRVTRHRLQRNANALQVRNAVSLLDQDQDQTKTIPRKDQREEIPSGLDLVAWNAWEVYRTKIGKTLKPISIHAAQVALAKFGTEQGAVVEQSVAQGWTGLFPLKHLNGSGKTYKPPRTTAEILAEEEREQQSAH